MRLPTKPVSKVATLVRFICLTTSVPSNCRAICQSARSIFCNAHAFAKCRSAYAKRRKQKQLKAAHAAHAHRVRTRLTVIVQNAQATIVTQSVRAMHARHLSVKVQALAPLAHLTVAVMKLLVAANRHLATVMVHQAAISASQHLTAAMTDQSAHAQATYLSAPVATAHLKARVHLARQFPTKRNQLAKFYTEAPPAFTEKTPRF